MGYQPPLYYNVSVNISKERKQIFYLLAFEISLNLKQSNLRLQELRRLASVRPELRESGALEDATTTDANDVMEWQSLRNRWLQEP